MAGFRIFVTDTMRALRNVPLIAVLMLAGLACAAEQASVPPAPAFPQLTTPAPLPRANKKTDSKPVWTELSPAQQQALAPLAGEWNKMPASNKEKWLAIGNKFAGMSPAEQERVQNRMRDWAKLTPVQRRSVRESYTRAKKLDADKKSAQWSKYQQLSEEQKKKLAQSKAPKHVSALPAARRKAAPAIQLPPEALEQTMSAPVPPPVQVVPSAPAEAK